MCDAGVVSQVWEMKSKKLLLDLPGHGDEVCYSVLPHVAVCMACCTGVTKDISALLLLRCSLWTGALTESEWRVEGGTGYSNCKSAAPVWSMNESYASLYGSPQMETVMSRGTSGHL